jgi:hypothetical protein
MRFDERLLLCAGAAQATLGHWRGNCLLGCEVFANDPAGLQRFASAIRARHRLPLQALVDAVEEDYRTEWLPHAGGRERRAMVQRRLGQLYRTSPYHAALAQGRDGERRRDDRYLFTALTNADLFLPWATVIEHTRAAFAGLFLLPLVMPELVERLGIDHTPTLVVTTTASGLRQAFIADGQLRASRLVPLAPGGDARARERDEIALLVEEVLNTRMYLEALNLGGRDDPLSVTLVDTDDRLAPAVAALMQQGGSIRCERVSAATVAQKLPLTRQMLADTPDALALTLLGLRPPAANLAPAAALHRFRVRATRRALHAAAGTVGLAGVAFALANAWQHYPLAAQAEAHRVATIGWQERYVAVMQQFPAAPETARTLQHTVYAARAIRQHARTPERAFAVLSAALDLQPEIGLRRISWRHGDPMPESDPQASGTAHPPASRIESLAIDAEVSGGSGDLRAAIASTESLARRLRADPRVASVVIARLPLDLHPGSSLSGSTPEHSGQNGASTFRLILQLRPAPT